jgi:hypothetical protein
VGAVEKNLHQSTPLDGHDEETGTSFVTPEQKLHSTSHRGPLFVPRLKFVFEFGTSN